MSSSVGSVDRGRKGIVAMAKKKGKKSKKGKKK
jgi:hypothetical protein